MNYTTTIEIERRLYILTFAPVYTFDSYKLFVRAASPYGEIAGFEMRKDNFDHWQVALPAPEWALRHKKNLVDLVERNS